MIERISLVEPPASDRHVFSYCRLPRLGLPILGALLKEKGYEVSIHLPAAGRADPPALAAADLIGISLTTSTAPAGYALADRVLASAALTRRKPVIVFGGAHATFLPEEAIAHGDYVIRGEAEESFPALVEAINGRGDLAAIPGLTYRAAGSVLHNADAPRPADLDALPPPDLTLIKGFKTRVTPILASRGCPHDCTFCCVTRMMGRSYRYCGEERVLSELRRSSGSVFFYDDNFAADRGRTKRLLRRMLAENLKVNWSAQVRADVGDDEELLSLMRAAGGGILYIGFESINPAALKEFRKGLKIEAVIRQIEAIKRHGFHIHGMFIFGADCDKPEGLLETARFAEKAGIDTAQFMVLVPLPGTPLFERLRGEGRLLHTDWRRYDGASVVFQPAGMSPYQLQILTHQAYRRFYRLGALLRSISKGNWIKAGAFIYARHTLRRWWRCHRAEVEALRTMAERPGALAPMPAEEG